MANTVSLWHGKLIPFGSRDESIEIGSRGKTEIKWEREKRSSEAQHALPNKRFLSSLFSSI